MSAWFYILRLHSGSLYCGSTRELEQRFSNHQRGIACRTTKLDPPIMLAYSEEFSSYKEAFRREQQVKKWTRAKKEALMKGNIAELKRLAKCRRQLSKSKFEE